MLRNLLALIKKQLVGLFLGTLYAILTSIKFTLLGLESGAAQSTQALQVQSADRMMINKINPLALSDCFFPQVRENSTKALDECDVIRRCTLG